VADKPKMHMQFGGPAAPKRSFTSLLLVYDIFLSYALGSLPLGTQSYTARRLASLDSLCPSVARFPDGA